MRTAIPLILLLLVACGSPTQSDLSISNEQLEPLEFFGNTQGTTFSIIVNDPIDLSMKEVEETLADFDLALSSYIPNSIITKVNEAAAGEMIFADEFGYFERCYQLAYEIFILSKGAFDPTVYPLVDGWGFMKDVENVPDSATINSLKSLVNFTNGYHYTSYKDEEVEDGEDEREYWLRKNTPKAKLDFNGVAQGLAVDVLAELIEKRGAENYFIEIGGEIRVKGLNRDGVAWRIGIDKPIEESDHENRELQEIIQLKNRSVATSGSYRKFYIKNGEKYSHTLNPKTGYPVKHNLLSATVVADDCGTADALATAFMVMGVEKGKKFLKDNPQLKTDVYLIFTNEKDRLEVFYTAGFAEMIVE
jgi:FAD:protein FMN transferase